MKDTNKCQKMMWIVATILAVIAARKCWGTTIVVIWTPTGTILGVDAKARLGNGDPAGDTCKIGESNNVIWAQSGILGILNPSLSFRSIISEELNSNGSIDLRVVRMERRISLLLTGVLNTPLVKEAVLSDPNKGQVQVVIVANEHGVSRVLSRSFVPERNSSGNIAIHIVRDGCPDSPDCSKGPQYFGLGFHAEADDIVKHDPSIWKMEPNRLIDYLIGVEIKSHPLDVGSPVAVVASDSRGVHWIHKGACRDKLR